MNMNEDSFSSLQENSTHQIADDSSIFHAVSTGNLKRVKELSKCGVDINSRAQDTMTLLHLAIEFNQSTIAEFLLEEDCDHEAVITSGPYSGYTPLHLACVKNNLVIAVTLLDEFNANCNVVADDGCMPIHIAVVNDNKTLLHKLLTFGAHVDAEFDQPLFEKYFVNSKWTGDFGERISLLALSMSMNKSETLCKLLIKYGACGNLKTRDNKTLLMMAVENHSLKIVQCLVPRLKVYEINWRDNSGFAAVHYLLHPSQFGQYRYTGDSVRLDQKKGDILEILIAAGAELNTKVNGDPRGILINMAAYRACAKVLNQLLKQPFYSLPKIFKPLYYATIPDNVDQAIKFYSLISKNYQKNSLSYNQNLNLDFDPLTDIIDLKFIELAKEETLSTIIQNLMEREKCHYPIVDEEWALMKTIIEQRVLPKKELENVKSFVADDYLSFETESLTFAKKKIYFHKLESNKELKILARNDRFSKALFSLPCDQSERSSKHVKILQERFTKVVLRPKLLTKFNKISFRVIRALLLPYDCLLNIISYLNIVDFKNFINSFPK